MSPRQLWGTASTGLVLAATCAASAWLDCMLLALSVVLAYRIFLLHMDHGAPWRATAAAVNALTAGALALGAGISLVSGIAAAWLGWWHPTAGHPAALLLMLGTGAGWCCLSRSAPGQALQELWVWLWFLGGALVAIEAQRSGWGPAPCLFVAAVGMAMLWAGWRLASDTASALLTASQESIQ